MTPFARATLALHLLALDSIGLGGMVIRARTGPARDAILTHLPASVVRLHPALPPDVLTGGIDVAESLANGALVRHRGLLNGPPRTFVIPMAERLTLNLVAPLCAALDRGCGHSLIVLDEGCDADETVSAALADRLAFHIDFDGLGLTDIETEHVNNFTQNQTLHKVKYPKNVFEEIVALAATLGITSLRAPSLALRTARAKAVFGNRDVVTADDLLTAVELVLAPRATRIPEVTPPEPEISPTDNSEDNTGKTENSDNLAIPDDLLLAAIKTALPSDLLDQRGSNKGKNASGSGAGHKQVGNRRGRPLPARDGAPKGSHPRVDLIATLRAAIPWQKLRRAQKPNRTGPIVYPSDLRYRRYEDLSDRLLVFAVDASGSAALARLAEAKGAVELLLAEAYACRDHVALISFRGTDAELLLPPTRSLVQTKRRLADLPGGGGTPLALGLKYSLETILPALRKGLSPVLILLTDGRSNIDLQGDANRVQAGADAADMALHIAATGIQSIVIDTGRRPEKALRDLATSLRGRYVSLPRADAQTLSQTVTVSLAS